MAKKREEKIKAYMCGVAWQHEVGETEVELYPSVAACEKDRGCTSSCGIVEVEVRLRRWMSKQDLKLGRARKSKRSKTK